MKKLLLFTFLFVFVALAACEFPTIEPTKDDDVENPDDHSGEQEEIKYLTVTEAQEMALKAGEEGTSEKQYVYGTVKSITNSTYGEMYITDGTTDLYVYGVYSSEGTLKYSELTDKPYTGDIVYLYGYLKTYKDSPELGASWLQRFVSKQGETDLSEYNQVSIAEARNSEAGSKLMVEGVVAKLTYASGMTPNGIYLVDNTGSIYIYGVEVSGRVKVGQKAKIAGVKTYYIIDTELTPATTYGYQGSIQLQDAVFVSASDEQYEFDKSWIEESTVKKMIETPLTNNITTNIFKVNAIIKEAPGVGFTNYYIDDLDGSTGSYCYSLANGKDYEYLKQFDGKICEVYLSALNCKCTNSGTVYRFVPIAVKEIEEFKMSDANVAAFALEYYAEKQFLKEYNSDPALEVSTSFDNEFIPFSGVSVSYESLNTELVSFANENEKLVMHINSGNANVKVKMEATYNGAKAEREIELFVNFKNIPDSITVAEAIKAEDGTEVVVRGIVMSGTVNQTGFYLNDGTGVIAVLTNAETLKTISLGNEIIIKGTKNHKTTKPDTMVGQIYIADASVEVNLLGDHPFDESPFITNLSFEDIKGLINDVMVDQTTNVYQAKCYINKVEGSHSTNYYLSSTIDGKDIYLYAGSGSQYSIFDAFKDQEVTVAFAFVNWNSKTPYRACIIYATNGETTVLNNYNFR